MHEPCSCFLLMIENLQGSKEFQDKLHSKVLKPFSESCLLSRSINHITSFRCRHAVGKVYVREGDLKKKNIVYRLNTTPSFMY